MNATLTLIELTDLLAESTSTSPRVCELFLRELFATVSQELIDGGSVTIKNIGTFNVVESKSAKSAKPAKSAKSAKGTAGKPDVAPLHRRIAFTPAKSLAEAVNQPFAQFETVILDDAVTDEKLSAIDEKYPSVTLDAPIVEHATPAPAVEETPAAPAKQELPSTPEPPAPEPVAFEVPVNSVTSVQSVSSVSQENPVSQEPSVSQENPPLERKPMLVGIPIDGPSHPVPKMEPVEEPKVDDHFYRPALRDAYSPTEEQLNAVPKRDFRWLWGVLAAVLLAGILWFAFGHHGSATQEEPAVLDTAEVYVDKPDVVTDTVTAQIVLTILSEKHYGSPWFWVYIYEENKDKISNPNNIKPGTEVVIPPAEKYGIDAKDPASLKKAQRRSWEILTLGKR